MHLYETRCLHSNYILFSVSVPIHKSLLSTRYNDLFQYIIWNFIHDNIPLYQLKKRTTSLYAIDSLHYNISNLDKLSMTYFSVFDCLCLVPKHSGDLSLLIDPTSRNIDLNLKRSCKAI